ncbi:hypothetical protein F2Q68_00007758 [Brassica cretica]|uniref:Uncharacterized protein n=1 Tax=Brassica cretica TaxID=69181 RepID=A0A8S9KYL5_BRACR|nr:hypothetical protein F2Q68_00007758 [Brassica cretica]
MERRKSYVIVALFGLLLLTEIVIAESDGGKGNGNNGKGNEGKVEKRKGGDDVKGKGNGNGPKDKDKNKNDKGKKDKDKKGRIRRKTRSRVEQLLVDTGCFHLCPQDKSRPCARVRVHVITKFLFVLVNVPKESPQKTKAPKVASLTALANATLHANVITFFELGGFGGKPTVLVTSVPPKTGVPRPVLGGEDKYQTPSLFSPTLQV